MINSMKAALAVDTDMYKNVQHLFTQGCSHVTSKNKNATLKLQK